MAVDRPRYLWLAFLALLTAFFGGPGARPAAAQYFGQNKVQYENFDFKVLKTEHFDIYYYEAEQQGAEIAGRLAERWYARLSRILDHQLSGRQPIVLYGSGSSFRQTNAISGQIGEATGGVTQVIKRRIVLPLAGTIAETDHVLGHELVHAFQFDITGSAGTGATVQAPGATRLPLWFIEGMAEYLSLGPDDPHTALWMRDAVLSDDMPSVGDLNNPKYFPYRYGQAFWAYVGGRYGDEAIGRMLKVAGGSGDAMGAIRAVLHTTPDSLSAHWHDALRQAYAPVADVTKPAGEFGHLLVSKDSGGGELNVAPALSPKGDRVVFFSEKSLFAVDMYLADAHTGKILRKLTSTAVDPHFQSLEFINSTGTWSPDGERFAFPALSKGRPVLTIIDPSTGEKLRELPFKNLEEIFTPSWSPDGSKIAFSANVHGLTDLYVVDLQNGQLRRLSDDEYAELQPSWSPDGNRIAFVTDRFGSDLAQLDMGDYRIAIMPAGGGPITEAPGFDGAKNIDPQWSPDGKSLFFLSNRAGIPNLYRVEVDGSAGPRQVTNLPTGISGITSLSPAYGLARDAGDIVFTLYSHNRYSLYRIDSEEVLQGAPPVQDLAGLDAGALPPRSEAGGEVAQYLKRERLGLADTVTFSRKNYSPGLSLDYIAQPNIGVGASSFGFFIGGGAALYWSDMLGNHQLATILQTGGNAGNILYNTLAVAAYQNLTHRTNWGVVAGQVPILSQGFTPARLDSRGNPVQDEVLYWQIERQLSGAISYPFNRVQRVELSAGFENIDFAGQIQTFSLLTGQKLADSSFATPPSINLATASAALVYDNSVFGGTGPVLGQRYRLEVAPNVGDLTLYTILVDYRKYFMPIRPLTLAGRILHYGRYGGGAGDARLSPLYLGYPQLVRGYPAGSFDATECQASPQSSCPVFDQLLGNRIGVFNAEARLPILGGLGIIPTGGAPPVDAVGFFDYGIAWNSQDDPRFFAGGGPTVGVRHPVTSYGTGLRVNLFGFAIGEVDYVHPNQRPQKGWFWQFSLTSGF